MKAGRPNFIVGIGSSAGGLKPSKGLLDALPPNTGMAFVFVAHLLPTANSQLALILSRHTTMTVLLVTSAMPIRANHVYVIPSNADLLIENFIFKVVSPRTRRNTQVDVFLTSLAEAMGPHAIGVILSGYDGDGTEGCRRIKAKGGITFAQDITAEVKHMPHSAQAAGCIDFIMPPDEISGKLQSLARITPV